MRVGCPKDQSQKPDNNMATVTAARSASAKASRPPGRYKVRMRTKRLPNFVDMRRRWKRCAITKPANKIPATMWIVKIGSNANEMTVVAINPR